MRISVSYIQSDRRSTPQNSTTTSLCHCTLQLQVHDPPSFSTSHNQWTQRDSYTLVVCHVAIYICMDTGYIHNWPEESVGTESRVALRAEMLTHLNIQMYSLIDGFQLYVLYLTAHIEAGSCSISCSSVP